MDTIERAAVIGAGVIGASWTALFLASGARVTVHDPAPETERAVRAYIRTAWPTLEALGFTERGDPDCVSFHANPKSTVADAQFVQESVPERLDVKHAVYEAIEPALAPDAIVASSASGLMLSEMQSGWRDPSRFVLGHPFNPPHLIPLVEVLVNERSAPGIGERAEAIYRALGKVTIRVKREVPGHVANRLQAALWREAINLVATGVASVEDVDKAVWAGPGLRWAAMGPTMLFHLGADAGGIEAFCARYADSFHRWWADLGAAQLDAPIVSELAKGVAKEEEGRTLPELSAERDALILAVLRALTPQRRN